MENIINIATLTIDTQKASDQIVSTRKEIFELQKANTDLRKAIVAGDGDVTEQTRKFVEQEQRIKALQTQYRQQSTALNEYTLENVKNSTALNDNVKSINQANDQNKELIKTRNQVDASTKDGAEAIRLINAKLDENNKFIKTNSSELEKQKQNVGNYGSALDKLDGVLEKYGVSTAGVRSTIQGFSSTVSGASEKLDNITNSVINGTRSIIGFKTQSQLATQTQITQTAVTGEQAVATEGLAVAQGSASVATKGLTLGFKLLKFAFIATGIGAIAILIGSIAAALSKSEDSSNKFSKSLSIFKGITSAVFKVLQPLGEFLLNKLSKAFETVGELAEGALNLVSRGLKAIGFDNAAKSVKGFSDSIKESTKNAQQLADAEAELQKANRLVAKTQKDFELRAEKLRQIRDDDSKSIAQRIQANTQLGAVLRQQSSEELELAQKSLNFANLKIKLDGKNSENLDNQAEQVAKIADIKERISSQESEQLSNLNSLRKDSAEKNKTLANEEKERQLKLLNDSKLKFESEQNTAEKQIEFYTKYYERLNFLQGGTDKVKNAKDLSNEILSIATDQINGEIEAQKKLIDTKKNISETEKNDLLKNAAFLKQTETDRVNASVLSATDRATALLEIETGFQESKKAIDLTFEEAEKLRKEELEVLKTLESETRLLELEEQGYSEMDLKLRILQEEHAERIRLLKLQTDSEGNIKKVAQAKIDIENKKYAIATKSIDDQVKATKIKAVFEIAQKSIQAAQLIFGESKALAIATALINTYQGISAQIATKPNTPYEIGLVIANSAIVAATGFAAVKNILNTDKGSSGGGGGGGGNTSGTTTPAATFENPAVTTTIASLQQVPSTGANGQTQTVLVLETLQEVQGQQIVKINSN